MRSVGLNLFVALALWSVAYVNSDRQEVVDAYRALIEADSSGVPYAICAQLDREEGGGIPPAELAWTWQNRRWR